MRDNVPRLAPIIGIIARWDLPTGQTFFDARDESNGYPPSLPS
ncbi:MAG: hypothetical protein AVDCRST_MAG18-3292 [uncultured Thermomicrobiales bacterium]|uniref:Uncharacterized protein n=1 Tax=uncultured Thermomicrobiales bacterium TaxID=1645740 RepID=A0A6J4VKS2_9BACT|nr:MAG: hypothetical protein AVDCRST_MAG18-3292 [uncultured Thermomicrobiales bacterium]